MLSNEGLRKKKKETVILLIFWVLLILGMIVLILSLAFWSRKEAESVSEQLEESKKNNWRQGFEDFHFSKDDLSFFLGKKEPSVILDDIYNILEIRRWIKVDIMNYLKEESSFFHEKYEGFANSGCSLMFKIVQKRVEKKVFFDILLYYHVDGCGGKSCNSSFFSRYPNLETKLSSFDNQKKILSDLNNEVFVFNISSVCCAYSGNIGHNTVLIITNKDKDFSQLRAYYCDSFGQDMPKVLRLFLLKTLGLKEKNIDYLKFRQQSKPGYCSFFAIENARIASELMLDKASFEEINKKLSFRPSVEHLKKTRIKLLKTFNKALGKVLVEKIKSFEYLFSRLMKKIEIVSLPRQFDETVVYLEKGKNELLEIAYLIAKNLEKSEDLTYFFFDLLENSVFSNFLSGESIFDICFKETYLKNFLILNSAYYEKSVLLLEKILEKQECEGCKSVLLSKIGTKLAKKIKFSYFLSEITQELQKGIFSLVPFSSSISMEKKKEEKKVCFICQKSYSFLSNSIFK